MAGKQEADDDEKKEDDEAEEEEQIEEEPNPYQWGQYTPKELYDKMAIGLVGCYFLCLCGFVPNEERTKPLYHQKKFDAVHVFATHMAKLVNLTTTDGKPLFKVILNMILIGSTGKNFLFSHHLHSCINFESKHSSQALKDQSTYSLFVLRLDVLLFLNQKRFLCFCIFAKIITFGSVAVARGWVQTD